MALSNEVDILYKADIKNALKNTKKIENATDKSAKGISGALKNMKAGWLAMAAGAAVVGGAFIKGIKIAAKFEQSIANVASVSGGSRKELAKLAREAGKNTVFSASKAADALYLLASAGLDTTDMAKTLTPTLNLAAAAQIGIAEATDLVVGQLKIFQQDMDEAESFTDIMAKTVSSANTNMQQLGSALSYVSPIAQQLGFTFEDTNALIAGMADQGIKAERAGTQLRGMLTRLLDPTEKMNNVFEKYNITQGDLKEAMKDPIALFKLLKPVTQDAGDAVAVFGKRNLSVAGIIKNSIPHLEKLRKEINNSGGAAKKMADVQLDTLESKMKLLGSAIEEKVIAAFKTLAPFLGKVITGFTGLLNSEININTETQNLIILQTDYEGILKKLNAQTISLSKSEKELLELRKGLKELEIITQLEKLSDEYKKLQDRNKKLTSQEIDYKNIIKEQKKNIKNYTQKVNDLKTVKKGINVETENQIGFEKLLSAELSLTGGIILNNTGYEKAIENQTKKTITQLNKYRDATKKLNEIKTNKIKITKLENSIMPVLINSLKLGRISLEDISILYPNLIDRIKEKIKADKDAIKTAEKKAIADKKAAEEDKKRADEALARAEAAAKAKEKIEDDYNSYVKAKRESAKIDDEGYYEEQLKRLELFHENKLLSDEEYIEAKKLLKMQADEAEQLRQEAHYMTLLGKMTTYMGEMKTIYNGFSQFAVDLLDIESLATENHYKNIKKEVEQNKDDKLATLQEEYENGLIDSETYYKKRGLIISEYNAHVEGAEKELKKKEVELEKKKIKADGITKANQIAINAAVSIMSAYASDPAYGIIMTPIINIMSGMQQGIVKEQTDAALNALPKYAQGGIAEGGLSLVGEQGAELLNLPGGTKVINNRETKEIMNDSRVSFEGANITVMANDPDEFLEQLSEHADNMNSNVFGNF